MLKKLALDVRGEQSDVSIFDPERRTLQRLTFDQGVNRGPLWLDDERLVLSRQLDDSEELYVTAADGSGVPEPLTSDSGFAAFATAVTDRVLLATQGDRSTGLPDIYMRCLDAASAALTPLLATPALETNAQLATNLEALTRGVTPILRKHPRPPPCLPSEACYTHR